MLKPRMEMVEKLLNHALGNASKNTSNAVSHSAGDILMSLGKNKNAFAAMTDHKIMKDGFDATAGSMTEMFGDIMTNAQKSGPGGYFKAFDESIQESANFMRSARNEMRAEARVTGSSRTTRPSVEEPVVRTPKDPVAETPMSPEDRRAKRNEFARENQAYKDKTNLENDAKSGIRYGRGSEADKAIFNKTKDMSNGKQYQVGKEESLYNANVEAIKSASGHEEVGKRLNIKDYQNMSTRQMREAVYQHHSKNISKGPSTMDNMWGNKVPQKVAGGLITASVVGSLFSSRGQQSNAQLYGQSPGPGQ